MTAPSGPFSAPGSLKTGFDRRKPLPGLRAPQYVTETERVEVGSVIVCKTCSAEFPNGNACADHREALGHSGSYTKTIYETVTKQILTGYRCSGCGASK